jgi:hypothetical protein
MMCVLPLIIQRKETIWRFQMEAHVAYTCKQILGLCHLPPQMEYPGKSGKNLKRKKVHTRVDIDGLNSLSRVYVKRKSCCLEGYVT